MKGPDVVDWVGDNFVGEREPARVSDTDWGFGLLARLLATALNVRIGDAIGRLDRVS